MNMHHHSFIALPLGCSRSLAAPSTYNFWNSLLYAAQWQVPTSQYFSHTFVTFFVFFLIFLTLNRFRWATRIVSLELLPGKRQAWNSCFGNPPPCCCLLILVIMWCIINPWANDVITRSEMWYSSEAIFKLKHTVCFYSAPGPFTVKLFQLRRDTRCKDVKSTLEDCFFPCLDFTCSPASFCVASM